MIGAGPAAVSGTVAPGYEPVREAFAAAADGSACAFAACVDGRLACDLGAGGLGGDAVTMRDSGTKGVAATALLAHAGGLPAVERPLERRDLADPQAPAAALAARVPMLAPGVPSYHALSWGWLAAELALRACGRTLGAVIRDRLAGPLGLDLRLGLSGNDPLAARLVRPRPAPESRLTDPDLLAAEARP